MNNTGQILISILALAAFEARAEPLEMATVAPPCLPKAGFSALDFSTPVSPLRTANNTSVLTELKNEFKVDTIFRYYDYPDDLTLPGKALRPPESDALLAGGFKIGVVFQHHNDNPAKFFEPQIGKKDAEQALALADENRQPFKTAIYFGIDGPEDHFKSLQNEYRLNNKGPMSAERRLALGQTSSGRIMIKYYDLFYQYGPAALRTSDLEQIRPAMINPVINEYFKEIEASFASYSQRNGGNGYNIGIYCTAEMCKLGASRGIKYIWLSPEGRFTSEYKELFKTPDMLNLVQWPETSCPSWTGAPAGQGAGFDFNQVNSSKPDLGTWDHKR